MPGDRKTVVIGRLKAKPLLVGQVLCALLLAGLIARWLLGGERQDAVYRLLSDPVMLLLIAAAAFGLAHYRRLWRQRGRYIRHDGTLLYRGGDASWPLATIRDVIVTRGELGIASLRLVVDDDSETTRELAKLYMLDDAPEAVRGGVLFAAAGVRGIPIGASLH